MSFSCILIFYPDFFSLTFQPIFSSAVTEEVAKLQKHLSLLRQEYVKMQQKLADTERRCAVLAAQTSGPASSCPAAADTFISRLLDIVANLYQQEQYRWGALLV